MAAEATTVTARSRAVGGGRSQVIDVLWYVMLGAMAVIFLFPFFWTISSSLKSPFELYLFPPVWIPSELNWWNYTRVLEKVPFLGWIFNSVWVVVLATSGIVLTSSLAAYAFARFTFRGRDLVFLATLGTMMLPSQVTLIPQFVLFHQLGWINSLLPLWVPFWFGGTAFDIFLIRQFLMTLPRDLDEAARIDGAGDFRVLWQVLLPLCKPVLATVAVISFIARWNDFIEPMIYINSAELFTVAVGLNFFRSVPESGIPLDHLLMAASVMTTLPCIVLFFLAQRFFVQGIVLSGIKG